MPLLKNILTLKKHLDARPYHLGTLGTGNHFIEICLGENQNVWIMLHSGSHSIGNRIGNYFREIMMKNVIKAIENELQIVITIHALAVNSHHNYVEKEKHFGSHVWLTRKGAVRTRKGDLGIIPGSMGAESFKKTLAGANPRFLAHFNYHHYYFRQ